MSQTDTIEFSCPGCNAGLRVPAHLAGVTGPCPHCQAMISAPHPTPVQQPFPAQTPVPQSQPGQPPQQYGGDTAQYQQTPPQQQALAQPQPQGPVPGGIPDGRPEGTPPMKQDVSSAAMPQPQVVPAERTRTHSARPVKRKVWPTVIFPAVFLLLAAACVYFILTLMGILKFGDNPLKESPAISEVEKENTEDPLEINPVKTSAGTQTGPDPQDDEPTPSPAPPEPVPAVPEPKIGPTPLEHDPQDVKKPGEVPADLPDITKKEDAVPEKNENFNRNVAAIAEAQDILKRFLSASSYEERKPFITQSVRSEEELAASCLSETFPKSSEPLPKTILSREKNRSFEVYFSVAFDEPDQESSRILYIRTISFSEDEPPKIHVDPFIDLFERTIVEFAKEPVKGTKTVHSLISYNAFCYDDHIPRSETMAKVTFYPNTSPGARHALASAYLSKTSKTFAELRQMGQGGKTHTPCTLTVAWDTEKDPKKPYLEVVRVDARNWKL